MLFSNNFYVNIKKVHIAHKCTMCRTHKCEYPDGRKSYGVIYSISGNVEFRFHSGERVALSDGQALFISPYTAYSVITDKEFIHYTVNFDIYESESRPEELDKPYCLLKDSNTGQLESVFKKLVGIWSRKKVGYEMLAVGCLYELLFLLYFSCVDQKNTESYRRLAPAKEYIEQHFDGDISLAKLAYLSDMSVTNFRREWKKIYTESPLQYRDTIRVQHAKEYLTYGYYTVAEIAARCGFDDVSYFIRFFKKKTGVTPGAAKKHIL